MNKQWLAYTVQNLPAHISATAQDSWVSEEISLLEWAVRSNWFKSPTVRKVDFFGHVFSRATVSLFESVQQNTDLFGCGRDESLSTALSKAYVETIERTVALEALNEEGFIALHHLYWNNDGFSISRTHRHQAMPPKNLRTTNGWAVHFDLSQAINNAFNEAIERHLLLLTFLQYGWSGFQIGSPINWDGLDMISAASPLVFCGMRAGIVATKVLNHPGYTFGYFCDRTENFPQSPRWLHAMMEGFEPARYYQNESTAQIREKLSIESNPMDRTQLRYVLDGELFDSHSNSSSIGLQLIEPNPALPLANVVVIDISAKWNLEFPLYAAYIFGHSLIPLFFKERLDPDANVYLAKILGQFNVSELPDVHPIL
jgi:hypothetical protein